MNLSKFSECLLVPFLNVFFHLLNLLLLSISLSAGHGEGYQSNNYYEFLEIMAYFHYWEQHIPSGVNSVLYMSPTALCHRPCNTPKSLLVSSCNFLQATFQTTKQKRPKRLRTLICTVTFHSSYISGNRQVPDHQIFWITRQYICLPQFLQVFLFTALTFGLYS
jgi:hypothetical protein